MKISVIIPVYKVENYLRECVDSVLNQTYTDIEVILVDDGSPDSCPEICDEYAVADARVKVVHKANGGLSDARNAGTAVATGDYVVYLDSDDYWSETDALARCVDTLNAEQQPDILYFRRFTFADGTGHIISTFPEFDVTRVNGRPIVEALDYLVSSDRFIPSACNKFVKRTLLAGIEFRKGIYSEDIDWNFGLTLKSKSLAVSNAAFYAYRKRIGSITRSLTERNVDDLLGIIERWSSQMAEINSAESNCLMSYCAYQLSIVIALIYYVKNQGRRTEFKQRVKRLKHLWQFDKCRKVQKVNKLRQVAGTNLAGYLLSIFIKYKMSK